jgi:hypothetical protein
MNTNDLKRLAGKAETESRSRAAAGAFPEAAATEGLLDVAVGAISSPIGDLLVVVTRADLAAIAFEGDEVPRQLARSCRTAHLAEDPAVAQGHGSLATRAGRVLRRDGRGSSSPSIAGSSTGSRATS